VDEWTPEVSARGWARAITDQAEGNAARDVLLVAEDDSGALSALVSGTAADDDPSGSIAEIEALQVLPGSARPRDRGSLLRAAASELANLSFSVLRLAVLTANLPARRFYEAMGDVQHKGFPDAALLGCPLIGEQPAITRHDVFADLDRCPGHIEGRPEQVEDRLRVREPEESGFFGGRHASCDLLVPSAKDHGTYEVASCIGWPPAYI
jgi:hypothetical protein